MHYFPYYFFCGQLLFCGNWQINSPITFFILSLTRLKSHFKK